MRKLPYPLDAAVSLTSETPEPAGSIIMPAFPSDSDEDITVAFRLSLNKFVALATAIDVGSDPAYGENAILVWYLWAMSMVEICEEFALCLTEENPAVVEALAELIRNNPTIAQALNDQRVNSGDGTPGQEVSEQQSQQDLLPENVKPDDECDLDALWGGMLYLVQSGNRSIVDVLEFIEAASNALEAMAITAGAIPAAGNSVSAAFEFANALQEFFAENYDANYTEDYEQQLACAMFCAARGDCTLSLDDMMNVINARFAEPFDIASFAAVMARIGTGSLGFIGTEICDAMFLLYFTAIKHGQQFGDQIGLRPLNIIISLGADQLASDNWEVLCECPIDEWESEMILNEDNSYGWVSYGGFDTGSGGTWVEDTGLVSAYGYAPLNAYRMVQMALEIDPSTITYMATFWSMTNGSNGGTPLVVGTDVGVLAETTDLPEDGNHSFSGEGELPDSELLFIRVQAGISLNSTADPGGNCTVLAIQVRGTGVKPSQLP